MVAVRKKDNSAAIASVQHSINVLQGMDPNAAANAAAASGAVRRRFMVLSSGGCLGMDLPS